MTGTTLKETFMGTIALLPVADRQIDDVTQAAATLDNAQAGYLRALEVACRALIFERHPPARTWPEKEILVAVQVEARADLLKLQQQFRDMLATRLKAAR
jgi:hypothetical protein